MEVLRRLLYCDTFRDQMIRCLGFALKYTSQEEEEEKGSRGKDERKKAAGRFLELNN